MADQIPDEDIHQIELIISTLLRIGVTLSLAIVILGTIVTFWRHPDYRSNPQTLGPLTTPGAPFPHTLTGVCRGLREFQGRAIIITGLLLLILTPVLRVAISIIAFAYEKDRKFVWLTTIVLIFLLLSFILGKAG